MPWGNPFPVLVEWWVDGVHWDTGWLLDNTHASHSEWMWVLRGISWIRYLELIDRFHRRRSSYSIGTTISECVFHLHKSIDYWRLKNALSPAELLQREATKYRYRRWDEKDTPVKIEDQFRLRRDRSKIIFDVLTGTGSGCLLLYTTLFMKE